MRKAGGQIAKTVILVMTLVFVVAFLSIFMMGSLVGFFDFFGYPTNETEIWDIFVPLLVLIVGPLLIVLLASGLGMGTTAKSGLSTRGR